jgi:gas vesicle structural protein
MHNDFESGSLTGTSGEDVSLLDILDHVLNAGVVIHGSLVLSIAGVDLVYLGLNVVLTSVETALKNLGAVSTRKVGNE